MKNKIMMIGTILGLMLAVSFFSGCIQTNVQTIGWNSIDDDSVELVGSVPTLNEYSFFYYVKFVYDTESHEDLEDYAYETEDLKAGIVNNIFSKQIDGLDPTTEYHFRAVASWESVDHPKDTNPETVTQQGDDLAFTPGNPEDSKTTINYLIRCYLKDKAIGN